MLSLQKQKVKCMDKNSKYREATKYITDTDNKITEYCHKYQRWILNLLGIFNAGYKYKDKQAQDKL